MLFSEQQSLETLFLSKSSLNIGVPEAKWRWWSVCLKAMDSITTMGMTGLSDRPDLLSLHLSLSVLPPHSPILIHVCSWLLCGCSDEQSLSAGRKLGLRGRWQSLGWAQQQPVTQISLGPSGMRRVGPVTCRQEDGEPLLGTGLTISMQEELGIQQQDLWLGSPV